MYIGTVDLRWLTALYFFNALWHLYAFLGFSFLPKRCMLLVGARQDAMDPAIRNTAAGDHWHHDLIVLTGYLNIPFAVLAGLRLFALTLSSPHNTWTARFLNGQMIMPGTEYLVVDLQALLVLAMAHGSMMVWDLTVPGSATEGMPYGKTRWRMGLLRDHITAIDTLLTVLDLFGAAFVAGRL